MIYKVAIIRLPDGLELDSTTVVAPDEEEALALGTEFLQDIAVRDEKLEVVYEIVDVMDEA